MSFAGHVLDMINRIQYNESLKKGRKSRYARVKQEYLQKLDSEQYKSLKFNKIPTAQLWELKMKIREDIINKRRRLWIKKGVAVLLSILITDFIIMLLINYFTSYYKQS